LAFATAVAAIAAFVLLFNLGGYRTLTTHESLVAVPARDMADSGAWLVPRFGGIAILTRPPLAHWLAAGFGLVVGEFSEWTVRLPFAAAGLALVGLMGIWGYRWYGRWVGAACALIQATSVYTTLQARLAEADILLCLLTTFAIYRASVYARPPHVGPNTPQPEGASLRWIVIYATLGLCALTKEFIGPILVILTVVSFLLIQGQARCVRDMLNPVGMIIFASLAFIWPYLVAQEHGEIWSVWYLQTVERGLGNYLEPKPFWFYAVTVPWLILPWTPLTLVAGVSSWKRAWTEADARERYIWVWFLSQVLFLSLSAGKHHHHIIPALPGLSLVAGQGLIKIFESLSDRRQLWLGRWQTLGAIVCWLAIVSGAALFLANKWPHMSAPVYLGVGLCGVLGFSAIALLRAARPYAAAAMTLLAYLTTYTVVQSYFIPARDPRRPAVDFARQTVSLVPAGRPIVVYAMGWTPVTFYIKRQVGREDTVQGLRHRMARDGTIYVVTKKALLDQIAQLGAMRRIEEMKPSGQPYLKGSPLLALVELTPRLTETSSQVAPAERSMPREDPNTVLREQ
jgi:4-amino-4-deoxy-L-arabinose transferase-like glycosyltransferase